MENKLSAYFPMIQSREEVLEQIRSRDNLVELFHSWSQEQQEEFLDFVTGARGVKMLYDFMFKEVMNPETAPERLEDFLSCLLGQKVTLLRVLSNDTTRIADEMSLLITDIVVELGDGSIVNLEVQKVGYSFSRERSACYSADLLLRQYKRIRSKRKKKFRYSEIQDVFIIVLFEKSPGEFHQFPERYLHRFEQVSDTGLRLELLQKYLFVPLDIFRKIYHNVGIRNKLEAWLAFLSIDDPEGIIQLLEAYPEFKPLYRHVYEMCQNMENIMGLFSKELQEMDRNTVRYMIDELQENLARQKEENARQKEENARQKEENARQKKEYEQQIAELKKQLARESV